MYNFKNMNKNVVDLKIAEISVTRVEGAMEISFIITSPCSYNIILKSI